VRASNFSASSHPKFWRYVMIEMPKVMKVPVIVRAMAAHGFMGTHAFRTALAQGHPPLLHLVNNLHNAAGEKKWGLTPPDPPVPLNGWTPPRNSILLEKLLADEFETRLGPRMVNTSDDPATSRKVIKAGSTILHELCHWGDLRAHRGFTDIPPQEHGEEFEAEVYNAIL
jgi:hypothetical protein